MGQTPTGPRPAPAGPPRRPAAPAPRARSPARSPLSNVARALAAVAALALLAGARDPAAAAHQIPLGAPAGAKGTAPSRLGFRLSKVLHRAPGGVFGALDVPEGRVHMDGRVLEAQAAREWVPSGPAFRAQEAGREMMVPDPKDLKTVLTLAYMAYDAYSLPPSPSFHQVPGWNLSTGFGWSEDGIRGYVFASFPDERGHAEQDDEVVVVSIKGTSPGAFGVGGPTSGRDKYNDNMMFSCCCGKLEGSWYTLPGCDCYEGHYTCSRKCLREVCVDWQDSYYRMAEEIVRYLQHLHPRASVWLVGHSLGGALAGITAQTLGLPAFAFEAPGDALFAARLGIVPEPGTKEFEKEMEHSRVYHWGNTGDPIFLGTCNGITSSCYISGYALESKCHLGRTCAFDLDRIGDPEAPPPGTPPDGDGSGGPGGQPGDGTPAPSPSPDPEDPEDPDDPDCGRKWWWPFPRPNCTEHGNGTAPPEPTPEPTPEPEPEEPEPDCGRRWWWPWPRCNDTEPAEPEPEPTPAAFAAPVPLRTPARKQKSMREHRAAALARQAAASRRPSGRVDADAYVSIQKHRMTYLINDVMLRWQGALPECEVEKGCEECEGWEFVK